MGKLTAEEVVTLVRNCGLRAGRGHPGRRSPAIEAPAAAVNLHREDGTNCTMAVWVLCPASAGAAECEDQAQAVVQALRASGAACIQEACQYDGQADRFSVRLLATWTQEQPFSLQIGAVQMRYAAAFSSGQNVELTEVEAMGQDEAAGVLSRSGAWTFTLEEQYPDAVQPPEEPAEPFALTVTRGTVKEVYSGCRWSSFRWEHTQTGLRRVRQGRAEKREVTVGD